MPTSEGHTGVGSSQDKVSPDVQAYGESNEPDDERAPYMHAVEGHSKGGSVHDNASPDNDNDLQHVPLTRCSSSVEGPSCIYHLGHKIQYLGRHP
jgi:hypothetical protein